MNIKNTKKIVKFLIKAIILFSTIFSANQTIVHAEEVVCTMDARMCPNGTFVGRTGPNCQFVCDNVEVKKPVKNELEKIEREKIIAELKRQIKVLQEKIVQILNERKNPFATFRYNLSMGTTDKSTNGEVTKLQKFLISEKVYPKKIISGYYGNLTAAAVRNLMDKYNIKTEPEYRLGKFSIRVYKEVLKKKKNGNIEGKICTKEYNPVCGEVQPNSIRCIKAPCPSNQVLKTFGNKCAQESAGVKFLYKGKCAPEGDVKKEDKVYDGKLKYFSNEKELKNFLEKNKKNNYYGGGGEFPFTLNRNEIINDMVAPAIPSLAMDSKSKSMSGGSDMEYSTTNVQIAGVDEADIVKNDGRYIYTLSNGSRVTIVDAKNPEELKVISSITADKGENINTMYLIDGKLVLLSNIWDSANKMKYAEGKNGGDKRMIKPYYQNKNFTRVEIYNILNPNSPKKEKTIEFEGGMNNSRVTNGHLYLLTNKYLNSTGPILPVIRLDGADISKRFGNGIYYFNEQFNNRNIISINAVNLSNVNDISTQRILMPYAGQIFVSQKNIYLTHAKYVNQNEIMVRIQNNVFADLLPITKKDFELIRRITNTDDDIISDWEKSNKISQIYRKYEISLSKKDAEKIREKVAERVFEEYKKLRKEFQKTEIQKFALNGTKVSPIASGSVSGTILNQFSMNEKKGFFHIATTNNPVWLPWQLRNIVENNNLFETENNLYILDKNLKSAGKVEGIAKGERIQSVRYVGDRAYMVTFKQVDPLFNIDISNPYNPKILGELKIPGFSQYLHPVFEDRLIGLGRDVKIDKNGRIRNAGIKVTLFDVSGNNPKEIKSIYLGKEGSWSEALNNHKAVLISETKGIMAFPASIQNESGYKNRKNIVALLKIEKDNIDLISELYQDNDWQQKAQRSIFIKNALHTIAPVKIRTFDLRDGEELGKVFLGNENKYKEEKFYVIDEIIPVI